MINFCVKQTCGSLNVIGAPKPIGSGTIRKCGLIGGIVSLAGAGFKVGYDQDIT